MSIPSTCTMSRTASTESPPTEEIVNIRGIFWYVLWLDWIRYRFPNYWRVGRHRFLKKGTVVSAMGKKWFVREGGERQKWTLQREAEAGELGEGCFGHCVAFPTIHPNLRENIFREMFFSNADCHLMHHTTMNLLILCFLSFQRTFC